MPSHGGPVSLTLSLPEAEGLLKKFFGVSFCNSICFIITWNIYMITNQIYKARFIHRSLVGISVPSALFPPFHFM